MEYRLMSDGSLRRKDPEGVRNRILDAAAELFVELGYCATGLQLLFERAHVTSGAFYHHFGTKKELGLAVIRERVAREVDETWLEPIRSASSTLQGITEVFEQIAAGLKARSAVCGCPLNNLSLELAYGDPEFRSALQEVFNEWTAVIEQSLKRDLASGLLPASADPSSLSTYVVAIYSGAMTQCKVLQSAEPLGACLAELRSSLSPHNGSGPPA
jgi:AcrR family transcriptional regulator